MRKRIVIGIGGASGSGKTYAANSIVERLEANTAVIIQEDSYYRNQAEMAYDERARRNYDHPDAFEHDLLIKQLTQLLNGESISCPVYDYKQHRRCEETKMVEPHPVIILEGILILDKAQLRELMDMRVFVDTALDVCFIRRLKRDIAERGRTADSVIQQYIKTVRPMYLQFIEPSKQYADILLSGEDEDSSSVDVLISRINALLHDNYQ